MLSRKLIEKTILNKEQTMAIGQTKDTEELVKELEKNGYKEIRLEETRITPKTKKNPETLETQTEIKTKIKTEYIKKYYNILRQLGQRTSLEEAKIMINPKETTPLILINNEYYAIIAPIITQDQ